jgi:DNA-binding transcriptional ArsR family regulator
MVDQISDFNRVLRSASVVRSRALNPGEPPGLLPILRHMLNHSDALDRVFQALADPTRRSMVERLISGPASVSDLAQPLAMSLPAVMQHLGVLEASSLVRSEKVGRVRTCRIEPGPLRMAEDWIAAQHTEWEQRLDRLDDYLAEPPQSPREPDSPEQRSTP